MPLTITITWTDLGFLLFVAAILLTYWRAPQIIEWIVARVSTEVEEETLVQVVNRGYGVPSKGSAMEWLSQEATPAERAYAADVAKRLDEHLRPPTPIRTPFDGIDWPDGRKGN